MSATTFRPPPARPLGLGGIMATTLAMYRAAPLTLVVLALISTLPVAVLATASDIVYGPADGATEQALRGLLQLAPILLLSPISTAATTIAAIDMLHGRAPGVGRALEVVGERFWRMAAVAVLTALGLAAGFAAFVIPGIVLLVLWLFAAQIAVVERRGVRASFARSQSLAGGGFWWTLLALVAFLATVFLANVVLSAILAVPTLPLSGDPEIAALGLVSFVATTVVQPVMNLALSLIYVERRLCRDGSWPDPVEPAGRP